MAMLKSYRERIGLAILGIVFVTFVGLLFGLNHWSQHELQTTRRAGFEESVKKRAEYLRFFFDDRKNDLEDIAVSAPLQAYFLNKNLGMSVRYGLSANLEDVATALKHLVETRRFGDFGTVYSRIVMVNATGSPLIDIVPERSVFDSIVMSPEPMRIPLFKENPRPRVRIESAAEATSVSIVVDKPLFHKGVFSGQLKAWIESKSFITYQMPIPDARLVVIKDDEGRAFRADQSAGEDQDYRQNATFEYQIDKTPLRLEADITLETLLHDGNDTLLFIGLYGLAGLLIVSGIVIYRNGTKRAVLKRELREAQKLEAVGQLAGGIAHEINTPAQYIGSNLRFLSEAQSDIFALLKRYEGLLDKARDDEKTRDLCAEIDAFVDDIDLEFLEDEVPQATEQSQFGVDQIARIVLAMKEFSHPSDHEKKAVDLNRAIENTITISKNEWKYAANVETAFDAKLPLVPCHAAEINQVFLNLLVNAAHAVAETNQSPELGRITVSTAFEKDCAVVSVQDNGTGIPEAIRDKVFNPFFTTKDVGKGTGQGLAITRDIVVKKHGGTIGFESKEGKGTTFTVRLPIAGDSHKAAA